MLFQKSKTEFAKGVQTFSHINSRSCFNNWDPGPGAAVFFFFFHCRPAKVQVFAIIYVHMHVRRSPMTCQNGCIELCKACRCCFYHKLVLRISKWCFYSQHNLLLLSLVAARSPWFFVFFLQPSACFCIVPAVLANQHSFSRADMLSRWYAFPLCSGLRGEEGFPLHLHHHPNVWAAAWIKAFIPDITFCSCKPCEMRWVSNSKDWHQKTSTCTNDIAYIKKVKTVWKLLNLAEILPGNWSFSQFLHRFSGPFFFRVWPSLCGWAGGSFRVGAAKIQHLWIT